MFFTKGQNWGFAPPHPQRQRERGYSHLLECLRFQMRHAGLLRLDHVMGLHRLYWIPRGFPATQGAYVSYPADELYALLSLESHRNQTALVGENLGTVPRKSMPPSIAMASAKSMSCNTHFAQPPNGLCPSLPRWRWRVSIRTICPLLRRTGAVWIWPTGPNSGC